MTLDEYEQAAARTLNPKISDNERLMDAAAGLAEEAGEVLGHVRKFIYQNRALDKSELQQELGDALWNVAMAARCAGLSLEQIAATNVAKLTARFPEGYVDR
jgi:NTP pyrophosphatase (non-canonical NTP hydrolase)